MKPECVIRLIEIIIHVVIICAVIYTIYSYTHTNSDDKKCKNKKKTDKKHINITTYNNINRNE